METSLAREEDRKARLLILEVMKIAARNGFVEEAKELGKSSKAIADRIANHDYRSEDEFHERWRAINKYS